MPKLQYLGLDRNRLTGPIPDSFGEFQAQDFYLILSHNNLSGPVPASLGKKKDFDTVDLSRNRLEGNPSAFFGSDKTIQILDLSRNLLEFDFSRVEFSKRLINLDLNHNKIYGSLPVGLTALDNLQGLNVSYNRLCGKIPVGGKLQSFDTTSYFHNRCLCGAPLASCK
ncbi:LRR domain containing protein [Parasponia andersonii]|uniref:LRR domain containing protein n=1 Tax=Parasponia andersonii TaxID=3476 RepID=A0A2P5A8M3_PARAD|nr:LRR domain containing protein [Parasponia andersonii]